MQTTDFKSSFVVNSIQYDINTKAPDECAAYSCFSEGDAFFSKKGSEFRGGYLSNSVSPLEIVEGCNLVQQNYLLRLKGFNSATADTFHKSDECRNFVESWRYVGLISQVDTFGPNSVSKKLKSDKNIYGIKICLNTIARMKNYIAELSDQGWDAYLVRVLIDFKKDEILEMPYKEMTNPRAFREDIRIPQYLIITNLNQLSGLTLYDSPTTITQPSKIRIGKIHRGGGFSSFSISLGEQFQDDENVHNDGKKGVKIWKRKCITNFESTHDKRMINIILN